MNNFDKIIKKVEDLLNDPKAKKDGRLPSSSYFLSADDVVCFPREFGDARRPYSCDGLTLWAYSSGSIKIEESIFSFNADFDRGDKPRIAFYFGKPSGRKFVPISITGAGASDCEKGVNRFVVYTDDGAYYIAKTKDLVGGVKAFVDENKRVRFELYLKNTGDKAVKTYLSAYYDLLLRHSLFEGFEDKWYRLGKATSDGYDISTVEYYSNTNVYNNRVKITRDYNGKAYSTTSPTNFKGGQHKSLPSAVSLLTGVIENPKVVTTFTESAVPADVLPTELKAGESVTADYSIFSVEPNGSPIALSESVRSGFNETYKNLPVAEFTGNPYGVGDFAFNAFLKSVMKQTEFCARAKNYAGALIGVRDIFQQLQAAILWIPDYCRNKMVEALNFIGEDGRPPRQYSYPDNPGVLPAMDLREFVDQGLWIISTFYTYLSFTGDYSILSEECGYYKFDGGKVDFSSRRDSALDHLVAITDFLVSNIDETTGCLRALYGDWNDALDGLGRTTDKDKKFGSGVSVMATMQLYQNLGEMIEILGKTGKFTEKIGVYAAVKENIAKGIAEYAIAVKGDEKKIVHGWGDKRAYTIGSFCDNDGFSRDSATSNAFFVLSGLIDRYPDMKKHILSAYKRLDSKYGIMTFNPYFPLSNTGVGRITRLPEGTAENAATYIHGTLFAIWSLFGLGDTEEAWKQIGKILPLTHEFISTTPFVMPNSYIRNAELGFDGESMSDWFTGSGCVLVKVLFFCAIGLKADLNGIVIEPSANMPFKRANVKFRLADADVTFIYKNEGRGDRMRKVNGKTTDKIVLSIAGLNSPITIEITD